MAACAGSQFSFRHARGRGHPSGRVGLDTALLKRAAQFIGGEAADVIAKLGEQAAYLVLPGYVIYTGGDYVDAPKLEKLGRVRGVLHVVETGLAVQP